MKIQYQIFNNLMVNTNYKDVTKIQQHICICIT